MAKKKNKVRAAGHAPSSGSGVPDQTGDMADILDRLAASRALIDKPSLVAEARRCAGKSSPALSDAIDAIEAAQNQLEVVTAVDCARAVLAELTGGD